MWMGKDWDCDGLGWDGEEGDGVKGTHEERGE